MHPRQVVLRLPHRHRHRLLFVFVGLGDIAEGHQLFDRLLGLEGVFAVVGRVHAALPLDLLPTGDPLGRRRLLEGREHRPSVHVVGHRQAEKREHGGCNVQQARPVDSLVVLDARPPHADHAELAMTDRRAGRLLRDVLGRKWSEWKP